MKDYCNENGGIVILGILLMISLFFFLLFFKYFWEIYLEMEFFFVEEGIFGLYDKFFVGELDFVIVIINDCLKELVMVLLMI